MLAGAGVGFCIHDLHGFDCPHGVTGPVAYLRFHGPTEVKYAGRYGRPRLRAGAERIEVIRSPGRNIYAYFNNDAEGQAVADARDLRDLLATPSASRALP